MNKNGCLLNMNSDLWSYRFEVTYGLYIINEFYMILQYVNGMDSAEMAE